MKHFYSSVSAQNTRLIYQKSNTDKFSSSEKPEENPNSETRQALNEYQETFKTHEWFVNEMQMRANKHSEFYHCGEQIDLNSLDKEQLNKINKWYFWGAGTDIPDPIATGKVAKQLNGIYPEKTFTGMFPNRWRPFFPGRHDAGDKMDYNYFESGAEDFFSQLPFVNEVVNWKDGDTPTEPLTPLETMPHNKLGEESLIAKAIAKKYLFHKWFKNESIEATIKEKPGADLYIIYGQPEDFLFDPRLASETGIVCLPKKYYAAGDLGLLPESYVKYLLKMSKELDMNEYEQWKTDYIKKHGNPFEY